MEGVFNQCVVGRHQKLSGLGVSEMPFRRREIAAGRPLQEKGGRRVSWRSLSAHAPELYDRSNRARSSIDRVWILVVAGVGCRALRPHQQRSSATAATTNRALIITAGGGRFAVNKWSHHACHHITQSTQHNHRLSAHPLTNPGPSSHRRDRARGLEHRGSSRLGGGGSNTQRHPSSKQERASRTRSGGLLRC